MQTAEQQQTYAVYKYDPKIGCVRRRAFNYFNCVILYNIDNKER